jgi:hypothetical protein
MRIMKKAVYTMLVAVLCASSPTFVHAQTIAELQVLIASLTQQILELERQIRNYGGVPLSSAPIGSVSCPTLTRSLYVGLSGADVTSLQQFLAADASLYPEKLVTGYFGGLTEAAVQRWQARHNVISYGTPDTTGYGVIGPATRAAITRVCAGGMLIPPPTTPPVSGVGTCIVGNTFLAHGETRTFFLTTSAVTCQGISRTCLSGVLSGSTAYGQLSCTSISTAGGSCTIDDITITHGKSRTVYKQRSVLFGQSCEPFGQARTCENGILQGNADYRYATCSVQDPGTCIVTASSTLSTTMPHNTKRNFYTAETVSWDESCDDIKQNRTCADGILSGTTSYTYPTCKVIPAQSCVLDNVTVTHGTTDTFYSSRSVSGSTECRNIDQERTCTNGDLSGSDTYTYAVCARNGQQWCRLDGTYVAHNTTATFYSQETVPFGNACSQFAGERTCDDGTLDGDSSYAYASCSGEAAKSCTLDSVTLTHTGQATFYSVRTAPTNGTCGENSQIRMCNDGILTGSSSFEYGSCAD